MPLTFHADDVDPGSPLDPEQIEAIYASGFRGAISEPESDNALALASTTFYAAFPEAIGAGQGKLSAPYKAALTLDPDYGRCEPQTTGDCVSHDTRNAGTIDYAVDAMFGETVWRGRLATEPIYGARGHGGQGASCSRLAKWVSEAGGGGFLPRGIYTGPNGEELDLSVYRASIGHNWGRRGTPEWVAKLAAENPAARAFQVQSLEEARDAIAVGFGLSRCGWWGYQRKRNEDGVSDVSGRWAHGMAVAGADDTTSARRYRDGLFLFVNSWGLWNSGPKRADQPDGSFWVPGYRFKAEINAGGVFAIASVRGYRREAVLELAQQVYQLSIS
jgi:hypothetical protein